MSHTHDPNAVLDYAFDWTAWLEDGESITDAQWALPDDLTVPAGKGSSITGGKTVVWVQGGTAGKSYSLTVHIVTSAGREDDRSLRLYCVER